MQHTLTPEAAGCTIEALDQTAADLARSNEPGIGYHIGLLYDRRLQDFWDYTDGSPIEDPEAVARMLGLSPRAGVYMIAPEPPELRTARVHTVMAMGEDITPNQPVVISYGNINCPDATLMVPERYDAGIAAAAQHSWWLRVKQPAAQPGIPLLEVGDNASRMVVRPSNLVSYVPHTETPMWPPQATDYSISPVARVVAGTEQVTDFLQKEIYRASEYLVTIVGRLALKPTPEDHMIYLEIRALKRMVSLYNVSGVADIHSKLRTEREALLVQLSNCTTERFLRLCDTQVGFDEPGYVQTRLAEKAAKQPSLPDRIKPSAIRRNRR